MTRRIDKSQEADTQALLAGHYAWNRPGFLLWHATLRWQREVAAALRPLGLTHAQFVFLGSIWYLTREGELPSQRQLAEHNSADQMMTSQVVRLLERRQLVNRVTDERDKRVVRLELTPSGKATAERAVLIMDRLDDTFFTVAGPQDDMVTMLRNLAGRDEAGNAV
jgi:DNA-binding MarR family transcriptional regulator